MTTWVALITAVVTALSRVVDLLRKKQEQEAQTVELPKRPRTVEMYLKRKRSQSDGSASGSPEEK